MAEGSEGLAQKLKQTRDEIALKIHLGSKDAQDEWAELEQKLDKFARDAKLESSAEAISASAKATADEIAKAYERLKKAL